MQYVSRLLNKFFFSIPKITNVLEKLAAETELISYSHRLKSNKELTVSRLIYILVTIVIGFTIFYLVSPSGSDPKSYSTQYIEALENNEKLNLLNLESLDPGEVEELANKIEQLFASVHQQGRNTKAVDLYSDRFYYNDTLHTFRNQSELIPYLDNLAGKLDDSSVTINDVFISGNNLYMKWNMYMEMTVLGKKVSSTSIGLSQFQFNQQRKIVLHQDFWDSTEGLFRHMPVLGGLLSSIINRI